MIKDSGNRTEFASGAVRDIQEGKGRCDLLPLGIIGELYDRKFGADGTGRIFSMIELFQTHGDFNCLYAAIEQFHALSDFTAWSDMWLEVAVHFEEGAKKYQANNWKKGIPVSRYIDSGTRHLLKWLREDTDERHDRAFCWNMLCAIWTCINCPELNEYAQGGADDECGQG